MESLQSHFGLYGAAQKEPLMSDKAFSLQGATIHSN